MHDADARHLYVDVARAAEPSARCSASAAPDDDEDAGVFRAPGADLGGAQPRRGRAGARARAALRLPGRRHLPSRGEAERARYALDGVHGALPRRPGAAGRRPASSFAEAPLTDGFVSPDLRLAVIPFRRLVHRRRAAAPRQRPRPAGRASPTCASATTSSTRTTASPASPASRPRPSPAITRDYLELEYRGEDKVFAPDRPAREDHPLRRRRRRRAAALGAGLEALGGGQGARPPAPRAQLAGELLNLYAERQARRGHAFAPDGEWQLRARALVPLPRDRRPDRRDRGGQGRHGVRAADGPADLRRRRLRQDRGRAARRAQGGRRGQAGDDAGADDDPRPAAPRHVHASGWPSSRSRSRWSRGCASRPRSRAALAALRRRQGRHPDRHPPAALARRPRQGPRPGDRRRGAALRRQAEGAAAPAEAARSTCSRSRRRRSRGRCR